MNKEGNQDADERLIQQLEDGSLDVSTLDESEQRKVRQYQTILNQISQSQSYQVPNFIRENFEMILFEEQEQLKSRKRGFNYWQVAAAVSFLLVGYVLGLQNQNGNEIDLVSLKKEVAELRQVALTGALQNYSASQRIQAVNQIERSAELEPDSKLVSALLETLNADESPNVRFAALRAIMTFENDEVTKLQLVNSLKAQTDPFIQIALIEYLVELEERSAIAPIREIIKKENISPEVKEQAERALEMLI